LCVFGCSTFKHNYPILRKKPYKQWQRSKDRNDRLAYWTTASAYSDTRPIWLYNLLTYVPGTSVDGRTYRTNSWSDVCEYATRASNRDLRWLGRGYRLI
jgi:hypothetical protein